MLETRPLHIIRQAICWRIIQITTQMPTKAAVKTWTLSAGTFISVGIPTQAR
jgi:hypothetical protein